MKENILNRRKFLKTSVAGACGAGLLHSGCGDTNEQVQSNTEIKVREYRTLGRTGFKASDIGFGAGLLTDPAIIHRAFNMGVNYVDTAESYTGGQSESAVGEALKRHDRESIFITTKLDIIKEKSNQTKEELMERFYKCLERLQTDYADCLMIHMATHVDQVRHEAFHAAFRQLKSDGKVRFLGVSNHGLEYNWEKEDWDSMENVFLAAAEDNRFDVFLLVYNFLMKDNAERVLAKCNEKNIGATLMKTNPVSFYNEMQGQLDKSKDEGKELPESYYKFFEEFETRMQKADEFYEKYNLTSDAQIRDAAIKFTLSNPHVHSTCTTFKNFDDLNAYISLSGEKLSDNEETMLGAYENSLGRYYCRHACGICESACPDKVPVNTIMRYSHYFNAHGREKYAMQRYGALETNKAEKCIACTGHCEKSCPYNVRIHSMLVHAHSSLTLT